MEYTNPKIPEGINTTTEHPLKEFFILTAGVLALIAIVVFMLGLAAQTIARKIPFQMELELAKNYQVEPSSNPEIQKYLQKLADRLATAQGLSKTLKTDSPVTVHFYEDNIINAFATLGGNIIFYRGMLEKLPSENALALVMSHEIAHIKLRHPIMALGRGVVIGLAVSAITGASGQGLTDQILGDAGLLTMLKFGRDQEQEADKTGLAAVAKIYGHINGTTDLFEMFNELPGGNQQLPQFLSSHPQNENRIKFIRQYSIDNNLATRGKILPMPKLIRKYLESTSTPTPAPAPKEKIKN